MPLQAEYLCKLARATPALRAKSGMRVFVYTSGSGPSSTAHRAGNARRDCYSYNRLDAGLAGSPSRLAGLNLACWGALAIGSAPGKKLVIQTQSAGCWETHANGASRPMRSCIGQDPFAVAVFSAFSTFKGLPWEIKLAVR
jgi:hypothetical protein